VEPTPCVILLPSCHPPGSLEPPPQGCFHILTHLSNLPSPSRTPRSGWQPPKDTGLWEISTQIKECIEGGMTPEMKEYWAAQGGYFEQV
jgi:hypothetical protein